MRTTRTGLVAALAAGLLACSGGGETSGPGGGGSDTGGMSAGGMGGGGMGGGGGEELPPASEDWSRDILTTAIAIDLASLTGEATITLAPGSTTGASFEIGDLTIQAVRTAEGQDLHYEDAGEALHVGVPAGA
ncbi:MAG: hypothetical protein KC731_09420, partial [Myxococcales bacterium]|nr:hypothetical protein [Myxococcales bacterium]